MSAGRTNKMKCLDHCGGKKDVNEKINEYIKVGRSYGKDA